MAFIKFLSIYLPIVLNLD